MVGAATSLYALTGDERYLQRARLFASHMLNAETREAGSYGRVLHDGDTCGGDCQEFKAPSTRYLLLLLQHDPQNTAINALLKSQADAIWDLARDPSMNLFATNWAVPAHAPPFTDREVNAACQALSLWAEFGAGEYVNPAIKPNIFEAEDGVLNGVGLASDHPGFSGWGYVTGMCASGQSVDVRVKVPSQGSFKLQLRYASEAPVHMRVVMDRENVLFASMTLASTTSFDTYVTIDLPSAVSFSAPGFHLITVHYNGGNGACVHLDAIIIL